MTGKQHLSLGTYIGISGGILLGAGVANGIGFSIGSMLGSLIPDIDSPSSMLSKRVPFIPKIINKLFGHRGITHAPLLYLLLGFALYVKKPDGLLFYFLLGLLIGCAAHLVQDMLTKGGIPLFYPFHREKINFGFLKSGSKADPYITVVLAILWIIGFWFIRSPMVL